MNRPTSRLILLYSMHNNDNLTRECTVHYIRHTMKAPPLYNIETKNKCTCTGKKCEKNRTIDRQREPSNNTAPLNIFPVQTTTQPCFSSPRQNREKGREKRQSGEAFFELSRTEWSRGSNWMCESAREKEREGNRDRGGKRRRMGALHNRPRHECSSTLVSTHPLQFQLSNGTSDSLHPLSHTVHKDTAHTHTHRHAHNMLMNMLQLRTHTNTQAHALMERDTWAHTHQCSCRQTQTTHTDTNIF